MDALILCGGLGTRLRKILKHTPKVLAKIMGKEFLTYQIEFLKKNKIRKIYLATGYLHSEIYDKYKHEDNILFSKEKIPLGTGGAILNYIKKVGPTNGNLLVINGDSFINLDIKKFIHFHKLKKSDVSICCTLIHEDNKRYGTINIDKNYKITNFSEKNKKNKKNKIINAGIYLFKVSFLKKYLPYNNSKISLEEEILPKISKNNLVYGYICKKKFIDIGTPESFKKSQLNFKKIYSN